MNSFITFKGRLVKESNGRDDVGVEDAERTERADRILSLEAYNGFYNIWIEPLNKEKLPTRYLINRETYKDILGILKDIKIDVVEKKFVNAIGSLEVEEA